MARTSAKTTKIGVDGSKIEYIFNNRYFTNLVNESSWGREKKKDGLYQKIYEEMLKECEKYSDGLGCITAEDGYISKNSVKGWYIDSNGRGGYKPHNAIPYDVFRVLAEIFVDDEYDMILSEKEKEIIINEEMNSLFERVNATVIHSEDLLRENPIVSTVLDYSSEDSVFRGIYHLIVEYIEEFRTSRGFEIFENDEKISRRSKNPEYIRKLIMLAGFDLSSKIKKSLLKFVDEFMTNMEFRDICGVSLWERESISACYKKRDSSYLIDHALGTAELTELYRFDHDFKYYNQFCSDYRNKQDRIHYLIETSGLEYEYVENTFEYEGETIQDVWAMPTENVNKIVILEYNEKDAYIDYITEAAYKKLDALVDEYRIK